MLSRRTICLLAFVTASAVGVVGQPADASPPLVREAVDVRAARTAPFGLAQPTWHAQDVDAAPAPRELSVSTYDSRDKRVIMFGGHSYTDTRQRFLNDTWAWDGESWTAVESRARPAGRVREAMAYDPIHDEVVLFGGQTEDLIDLGDTWVLKDGQWAQLTPAQSPPPDSGWVMAFDHATQQLIMFGNRHESQTWTWDGTTWTLLHPADAPYKRIGTTLAYDPSRGGLVLFGGAREGEVYSDTWLWDGTTWLRLEPLPSPSRRYDPALATFGGHVVLFGGHRRGRASHQTWMLRADGWRLIHAGGPPAPRQGASMTYDAQRKEVVLFGGSMAWEQEFFSDTWTLELGARDPTG